MLGSIGHREPVRTPAHPRVVSLALWAIHLLAIPRSIGISYAMHT